MAKPKLLQEFDGLSAYASNQDMQGIYTQVDYKRSDGTLYMRSTASNQNQGGSYQTLTWTYYDVDGTTQLEQESWALMYDNYGRVTSRVLTQI